MSGDVVPGAREVEKMVSARSFIITFAATSSDPFPPWIRVKALLKRALRDLGLKCTRIKRGPL
jgi:hypothetical protein